MKELNPEIETWSRDLSTTQTIYSLVERLIELEEIGFNGEDLYWRNSGSFVDESLNKA